MAHKEGEWWSDKKRFEVVTTYLILGKAPLVEAATGVPAGTVRRWKRETWWQEMVDQIQTESDQELDTKLAGRIDKALDVINDRLENGDFQYDPRTGEFVRKPVAMKDANKVLMDFIDKRWLMRKNVKETVSQEAVGDILKNLAKEFSEMAKKKVKDGTSETELPNGVQELSGETGTNQEPVGT